MVPIMGMMAARGGTVLGYLGGGADRAVREAHKHTREHGYGFVSHHRLKGDS